MMFIVSNKGQVTEWHFGSRIVYELDNVLELHADGDELDAVKKMFPNAPVAKGKSHAKFYGDFAKVIVGNLISD